MPARKRRKRKHRRRNSDAYFFLILLGAILIVGAYLYYIHHESRVDPWSPEDSAHLVTDDRILYGGAPRALTDDRRVAFTMHKKRAFIVGYSDSRKNPLWVFYRVVHTPAPFNLPRPQEFLTDTQTLARVRDFDFTDTGFDRGHMAPNGAIARSFGPDAQLETFYLSNISPQSPALNRNVWERLESVERQYIARFEEIWAIAGPIFADISGGQTRRLASGIAIPSAFYKILVDEQRAPGGRPRLFAVIMPQNVKGHELPQEFLTSVDVIESQTGLDFLWKLDDATENELEAAIGRMWSPAP